MVELGIGDHHVGYTVPRSYLILNQLIARQIQLDSTAKTLCKLYMLESSCTEEKNIGRIFWKISADNTYPFREVVVNEAGNKRRQITTSSLRLLARIDCTADTSEVASFSPVLLHGSRVPTVYG